MGLISTTALHHLRLTVTDLGRSRAFYEEVLGFEVAAESPGDPSDPAVRDDPAQLYGGVVYATNGILFGLRPVADASDTFVSTRVGLDHVSFAVASRAELETAKTALQAAGDPARRRDRAGAVRHRDPVVLRPGRRAPGAHVPLGVARGGTHGHAGAGRPPGSGAMTASKTGARLRAAPTALHGALGRPRPRELASRRAGGRGPTPRGADRGRRRLAALPPQRAEDAARQRRPPARREQRLRGQRGGPSRG